MRAMYFLTPHHSNIGDNAQAYCLRKMLVEFFGVEGVLEFNMLETSTGLQQVKQEDILFLSSGGNLGDLWINGEKRRRQIIQGCPKNTIVSFPQTIFFNSQSEANLSSKIYNTHPSLYLFTRDPESYIIAKNLFSAIPVHQLPDPVFTISRNNKLERKGVLCIFRNDKENWLQNKKQEIIGFCRNVDPLVTVVDTELDHPIKNRETELFSFLDLVSKYRLVVTDRFHGTIFAAVTGTPCIALPTINHKITAMDYWYKRLDTKTVICKDVSELAKLIFSIPEPFVYNPSEAVGLYYQVISSVKATRSIPCLNNTEKVILSRRTSRKWRKANVSKSVLQDIIKVGVYAPTGSNAQCVRFKVVEDKAKVESISKDCFGRTSNSPSVVLLVGYDFNVEKTINFNHKHAVWEPLKYQDVAAAVQNMLLYCESIGLSCCWLTFFTGKRQEFLNSIGIKDVGVEYLSGIALGFVESNCVEMEHSGLPIARKSLEYYIR